ncbi:hypothetical protein CAPTEDRAFT_179119 [Capitella teleta]|uniref:Guanylate cyclase n=1 Tax=Capitella teleta TaxID=283909 RepID=R7TG30_CAPTE|nr:hypothetical protein CAPTEDRAFT_179119 [Capitella teleta]|eukprot:ELT90006.1 hypothetical protein CAPTEDRAFT_179119 [Capitella teleta]
MDYSILVFLLLVARGTWAGQNFTVGYLMSDMSSQYVQGKQGRVISGAMTYAISQINADPHLLAGHSLRFMTADTEASTLVGTSRVIEQWRAGAIAFFGPEDSCDTEARVAAALNLPMISYKCADHRVSDKKLYPTFARTFPPANQVTKSILALLLHFSWRKITLVVGDAQSSKWRSIAEKLTQLAELFNVTINGQFEYKVPHVPTDPNPFPRIVEESYIDSRIYVFLGDHNGMVTMMTILDERGLLATGEYLVIYTQFTTYNNEDPLKYFKRELPLILHAAQSLLIVVSSPPSNPDYADFHLMVNGYNELPPFSYPNPFDRPKQISVYAAYLYDSVFLYARALDEILQEGGDPRNGSGILAKILGRSYQSIQGFLSYMDDNGDTQGNYTVLARAPSVSQFGNYTMLPVGHFQIGPSGSSSLPSFVMLQDKSIDWVRGVPPRDEPPCGYRGEKCIIPRSYTLEIACGVFGGILLVGAIVILVVYRNWRYEQEIAGLLWKVPADDIMGLQRNLHTSRVSLQINFHKLLFSAYVITIGSQGSYDSRVSLQQVFTPTGQYKGQVVALKKFVKRGNVDITRNMKKEMKLMKDLRHDNVNTFVGACVAPSCVIVLTEYCSKGSLQDILENDDVRLDSMFIASLVHDLIKSLLFLHDSELHTHGNLKSSNCVVNSRWSLQVADFGLFELRHTSLEDDNVHAYYRNKLWTAPELLRDPSPPLRGTQKGDVYAFGIILYEILGRAGPYGNTNMSPAEIVHRVKEPKADQLFRPDISILDYQNYILSTMTDCWAETSWARPDFRTIRTRLKPMREGMKTNIFDNMMAMMEKYQGHLEDLVADRTDQLMEEKKKTEGLLHRMLPKSVADQLITGEPVIPETFHSTTIYFSDICGFTSLSAESNPMQVVDMLNDLYTTFDSIIHHYDVYKVETIGDAYMVVSGLPLRNGDNHAGEIASMSLHLLSAIKSFKIKHRPDETLKLRIGIHTGSCVAGVVGLTMPRYCLFGDTVNTASRMESNGQALRIHVSQSCTTLLEKLGGYVLEPRGLVSMKGKGDVYTYWLNDEDKSVRTLRYQQSATESPKEDLNDEVPGAKQPTPRGGKSPAEETESTFFQLMREGEALSRNRSLSRAPSGSSGSRRRSMNKDCNSNGFVVNGEEGVAMGDLADPSLPTIVVETEPSETDRLLTEQLGKATPDGGNPASGVASDISIPNTSVSCPSDVIA